MILSAGDVRLFNLNVHADPQAFLQLSAGTVPSPPYGYCEGARVPRLPWRSPTDDEIARLMTTTGRGSPSETVTVLRVPDALVAILRHLTIEEMDQAVGPVTEDNPLQQLILEYLQPVCAFDGACVCHGLICSAPNLLTVSRDPATDRYNGLHVDSMDWRPGKDRRTSQIRIAINVGKANRYLLFVNHSVAHMADLISAPPSTEATEIGLRFLESRPDLPVVRVLVKPGEAYIAATDNMVHDGSTEGVAEPTWHLTLRGHISPRQQGNRPSPS